MIRFRSFGVVAVGWMGMCLPAVAQEKEAPEKVVVDLGGGVKMEFVRVKAGKFTMGDMGWSDAQPHEVTISQDFLMQTTETTQAQWRAVMGKNPAMMFKGADLPVESVSWEDCREFLKKLNEKAKDQLQGKAARLPTEAQWEYACRAGSTTKWCFGDDPKKLGEYAWYEKNSRRKLQSVGRKKPNAWGLYDMHGNAMEWCEDWYGKYPSEAVTDPTGPGQGDFRSVRGGNSVNPDFLTRSARRYKWPPARYSVWFGLRVALRS